MERTQPVAAFERGKKPHGVSRILLGVGKAVESQSPEAWGNRIVHVIDDKIAPHLSDQKQEWIRSHHDKIVEVANYAGVGITVAEIAAAVALVKTRIQRLQAARERTAFYKFLMTPQGLDAMLEARNPFPFAHREAITNHALKEVERKRLAFLASRRVDIDKIHEIVAESPKRRRAIGEYMEVRQKLGSPRKRFDRALAPHKPQESPLFDNNLYSLLLNVLEHVKRAKHDKNVRYALALISNPDSKVPVREKEKAAIELFAQIYKKLPEQTKVLFGNRQNGRPSSAFLAGVWIVIMNGAGLDVIYDRDLSAALKAQKISQKFTQMRWGTSGPISQHTDRRDSIGLPPLNELTKKKQRDKQHRWSRISPYGKKSR